MRDKAIDDPSPENVAAYYYLQRVMMDKAQRFTDVARRVVMSDPLLDENQRRPIATFAANKANYQAGLASEQALAMVAKQAGILFFFRSDCRYCHLQAPLLTLLEKRFGFKVYAVSLDGQAMPNGLYPDFRVDQGQGHLLGVVSTPALFLMKPPDNIVQLAQGAVSLDDLSGRILLAAKDNGWQEMDAMFGTMTNATSPTAHLGQRRGVISAGSVVSRNRVMNTNMVTFVPPSFSAGCGGIDLFGGSFSFINMNQFVDLMRAVASNAAGYAFQLAINAMCPDCGNVMSDLQKKVQQLNQMFSNSCQLAQGLVNDAASVLPEKVQSDMKMSTISFSKGVTDVFGALTNSSSQGDPVQQVKANAATDMQKVIQGNLVWRSLNQNNAGGWFKFGGNEFLQAAMSVTGSVVVKPPESAPDGKGESNPIVTLPNLLRIKDLLNGSGANDYQSVQVYECDTTDIDGCLNPVAKGVSLVGLKQRVRDMLAGSGGGNGLVYKFATNTGPLTQNEMAFMELVPGAVSAMIRNLAREDYGMAKLFADEGSPVIALEMAQLMVQGMLDAVRQASSLQDHAYAAKLADTLDKARQELQSESAELSGRYGNTQSLLQFYTHVMNGSKAKTYGSFTQSPGSQPAYPTP